MPAWEETTKPVRWSRSPTALPGDPALDLSLALIAGAMYQAKATRRLIDASCALSSRCGDTVRASPERVGRARDVMARVRRPQ
jgi:hypothetical protein